MDNNRQDKLSEQDASIEEELQSEANGQSPDASNEGFQPTASGNDSIQQAPNGGGGGKVWIAISTILVVLLIIVLIKPPFGASNETVASVNGVKISKDKLYDALVDAGGKVTLENMITQELILQEAQAAGVTVTDEDIDSEINLMIESFGSEEAFNSALANYNMTVDSLKKDTKINLTIRKILEPKTDVTDEEVQAFFDANQAAMSTPEQIQASHILVATKEEADAILAELKQGGDFATIAKEKSTDTNSKENGGDLGFFGAGEMLPAFEEAAFALAIDEISGAVQSEYGYHIIKKTAEKAAVNPTFEEKKDEIRKQLVATEANELSEAWMSEIRAKAKITNSLTPEASEAPASDAPAAE